MYLREIAAAKSGDRDRTVSGNSAYSVVIAQQFGSRSTCRAMMFRWISLLPP
jgi:hypothetical protein